MGETALLKKIRFVLTNHYVIVTRRLWAKCC